MTVTWCAVLITALALAKSVDAATKFMGSSDQNEQNSGRMIIHDFQGVVGARNSESSDTPLTIDVSAIHSPGANASMPAAKIAASGQLFFSKNVKFLHDESMKTLQAGLAAFMAGAKTVVAYMSDFLKALSGCAWVVFKALANFYARVVGGLLKISVWLLGGLIAGGAACFLAYLKDGRRVDFTFDGLLASIEKVFSGDDLKSSSGAGQYEAFKIWCTEHSDKFIEWCRNRPGAKYFIASVVSACAILSSLASLSMGGIIAFAQVNIALFVVASGFGLVYQFPPKPVLDFCAS